MNWKIASIYDRNFEKLVKNGKIKKLFEKYGMSANYNF